MGWGVSHAPLSILSMIEDAWHDRGPVGRTLPAPCSQAWRALFPAGARGMAGDAVEAFRRAFRLRTGQRGPHHGVFIGSTVRPVGHAGHPALRDPDGPTRNRRGHRWFSCATRWTCTPAKQNAPLRAARKLLPIGRACRPDRDARRGAACDPHRPIVKHLANHLRPDGYTRQVGATPDGTSRMRSCSSGMPLKTASLCPFPFPYQIWFEGDAVRARTAKGLFRRRR